MMIQTFVLIDRLDVKQNFSWTNKAIGIKLDSSYHKIHQYSPCKFKNYRLIGIITNFRISIGNG